MQNRDGGWAAFDVENDKIFLNKIPFSDMDSLCDPSSPDVTGRVIEAFGLSSRDSSENAERSQREIREACVEASIISARRRRSRLLVRPLGSELYLRHEQRALRPARARHLPERSDGRSRARVAQGCAKSRRRLGREPRFLRRQKIDGARGDSTASQTAWALMGLLELSARRRSGDRTRDPLADSPANIRLHPGPRVRGGVACRSPNGGTWNEEQFTGTGFPNHFYLRYHYYRHYFPMMALGRYLRAPELNANERDFSGSFSARLFIDPTFTHFSSAFSFFALKQLRIKGTLLYLVFAYLIAFACEYSSTRNGFPFGIYAISTTPAIRELWISNVPFWDSLSFVFLSYFSWILAASLRGTSAARLAQPFTAVLAGVLMMLLDVVIDPLTLLGDRWFLGRIYDYPTGGTYFGVTISNFAGWFFVGAAIPLTFQRVYKTWKDPLPLKRMGERLGVFGVYSGVFLFNLGITAWIRSWDLLLASSAVAIFTLSLCGFRLRRIDLRESEKGSGI